MALQAGSIDLDRIRADIRKITGVFFERDG
jgi:hypothetical protein